MLKKRHIDEAAIKSYFEKIQAACLPTANSEETDAVILACVYVAVGMLGQSGMSVKAGREGLHRTVDEVYRLWRAQQAGTVQ